MSALLQRAAQLNRECFCVSTDVATLQASIAADLRAHSITRTVLETHQHLFASLPVFVAREHVARMQAVISAVETVVRLPAYRQAVLRDAPTSAQFDSGTPSVFLGYDFHLGASGPQLIEINTNAGGALLNAALARAQIACCDAVQETLQMPTDAALEAHFLAMFKQVWRTRRGAAPLLRIAIVDEAPAQQYLFPEFLLFQRLFESHGIATVIVEPSELRWASGQLTVDGAPIDLVYNRLTDFYLAQSAHAALLNAYLADAVVMTPNPVGHALYANKRNLVRLRDAAFLGECGADAATIALLQAGIPDTIIVKPELADELWAGRKQRFFKPVSGFASKGAYRGDKLTQKAFAEILAGDYVAQALVPPSERMMRPDDRSAVLKLDLRNYVFGGAVQLVAARLYQGQTTNFRTPGGGFAPVFYAPDVCIPELLDENAAQSALDQATQAGCRCG